MGQRDDIYWSATQGRGSPIYAYGGSGSADLRHAGHHVDVVYPVLVPDLRGFTLADAIDECERIGLCVESTTPLELTTPRVVDQDPPPGTEVPPDAFVNLVTDWPDEQGGEGGDREPLQPRPAPPSLRAERDERGIV